jgi:hypothetical protein
MNTPIPQFGRPEAPFNVVPVDFVVDAIAGRVGRRAGGRRDAATSSTPSR